MYRMRANEMNIAQHSYAKMPLSAFIIVQEHVFSNFLLYGTFISPVPIALPSSSSTSLSLSSYHIPAYERSLKLFCN